MGWLQVLQKEATEIPLKSVAGSVLLVDDEVEIIQMLSTLLIAHNYLVFEATSGEEGLRIYREKKPQIVITDLKMPGFSGLDLLQAIREQDNFTEVIVLTAYSDSKAIITALKNNASDFVLKPVDVDTLLLTIDRALERLKLKERVKNYTEQLESLLHDVNVTKDYLEKIVENSPQAIIAYDEQGVITAWNSEAEKITGYPSQDAIGRNLRDIFVMEEALIKPDADTLSYKNVVAQVVTRTGDICFISRNANAVLNENGQIIGGIENFYDITEQIKNDQLLQKRYLQLQTINEIGKKIASCNDLKKISQFVSDRLVKTFFESSQITIFYYNPEKDGLVLTAMSGLNIDRIRTRYPVGSAYDKNRGIIGHVFNTGKEIIANDVHTIPFYQPGALDNTRSEFAFPIRFKDQVFGVLNIENIENIEPDEADRFMLETIAEYLGIGKERIELMGRITKQNHQLELQAEKLRKALNKVESQKEIIEEQNKRLINDLKKAAEFQRSLLPESLPDFDDLKLAGLYVPSSQLGGDFYDVMVLDDRYVAIVLADASGHGVAAAMLSAMFKMTLQKYADQVLQPAQVLQKMNRDFSGILQMGEFFSAFLAVYDREENKLHYSNAGHPRPVLFHYDSGEIEELDTNGFLLGILSDGIEFEQKEKQLNGKTRLMIYTDGINEAVNAQEEQFGVERIHSFMKNHADQPPDKFILNIRESLAKFTGDDSFEDDITIIVADRL